MGVFMAWLLDFKGLPYTVWGMHGFSGAPDEKKGAAKWPPAAKSSSLSRQKTVSLRYFTIFLQKTP
jgi:hypothetical protein